jgi:hypothetical protein
MALRRAASPPAVGVPSSRWVIAHSRLPSRLPGACTAVITRCTWFRSTTRPSRSRCRGPRTRSRTRHVAAATVTGALTVRVTVPTVAPEESLTVPASTPVATRFPFCDENRDGVKVPAKEPPFSAVPVIGVARAATGGAAAGPLGAALATPAPAKLNPNAASTATTMIESRCRCVIVPPADCGPPGFCCHRQAWLAAPAQPSERCHQLTVSGVRGITDESHVCRTNTTFGSPLSFISATGR